jgi:hypothetical protein
VFVPEWAIEYPHGTRLLFEYCTQDNVKQRLKKKIDIYGQYVTDDSTVILFVLDVSRERVVRLVEQYRPADNQVFADYQSFIDLAMGTALTTSIYLWWTGERAEARALR